MTRPSSACAQFANASEAASVLVEISNDLHVDADGWAQIAPLGDFPGMALIPDGKGGVKKVKAIQRIDATAVAQMANSFNSSRRGSTGFLKGAPIYLGHPDVPGCGSKYPDKSPKGVFPQLAGRLGGLFGEVILFNEGQELLAGGKKLGLSGRWNANPIGEENGVPVYRPDEFLSAGLTDRPNLPVQLLNEAEPTEPPGPPQLLSHCAPANHRSIPTMKTTPATFFNELVSQTMASNRIGRAAAKALVQQAHPDVATLHSATSKTHSVVAFFHSKVERERRAPARAKFQKLISDAMNRGMTAAGAFAHVKLHHADIANAASSKEPRIAQFRNSGVAPAAESWMLDRFGLPYDLPAECWAAVWEANGRTFSPVNPSKCFSSLVALAQKSAGLSYEAALANCKVRYPLLWGWVQSLAKETLPIA